MKNGWFRMLWRFKDRHWILSLVDYLIGFLLMIFHKIYVQKGSFNILLNTSYTKILDVVCEWAEVTRWRSGLILWDTFTCPFSNLMYWKWSFLCRLQTEMSSKEVVCSHIYACDKWYFNVEINAQTLLRRVQGPTYIFLSEWPKWLKFLYLHECIFP